MNKPLPTMPGKTWQPMEVANLRARYPKTCWEPLNRRHEVCALPKGHRGRHGAHLDGDECGHGAPDWLWTIALILFILVMLRWLGAI